MSDYSRDLELSEALRGLPTPEPSADFDDCVLAALHVPVPWWRRLWQPAKPLLLGTSCSLGVTLLLLHLTLSAPVSAPAFSPTTLPLSAAASKPMPPLDALLDRPNLCAGSLAAAWNSAPATSNHGAGNADGRPEPRRRAEVSRHPSLAA